METLNTDTPRNDVLSATLASLSPVRLMYKINYHRGEDKTRTSKCELHLAHERRGGKTGWGRGVSDTSAALRRSQPDPWCGVVGSGQSTCCLRDALCWVGMGSPGIPLSGMSTVVDPEGMTVDGTPSSSFSLSGAPP